MKIVAVICEYNPFHLGHEYQLGRIREEFGADSIIVGLMSGSFVQRGEPAILDKYARAGAAVGCGCDVIFELPAPWSMSGAEFFARAGVSLADSLGCVDILAFGSEVGDLGRLSEAADRLDSEFFRSALSAARARSPEAQTGALRAKVYRELYGNADELSGSNDLLALEYLRALKRLGSDIAPFAIRRRGADYNDDGAGLRGFASATSVRRAVLEGKAYENMLPPRSYELLRRELEAGRIARAGNLDCAVSAFLRLDYRRMRGMMEVSGGIENRLHMAALAHSDLAGIIEAAAERRYSASRLRRAVFGSMAGYTMRDCEAAPEYLNLLAANERGRRLLARLKKTAKHPILTKPSDANRLGDSARVQFERSLSADMLWLLALDNPSERSAKLYAKRAVML